MGRGVGKELSDELAGRAVAYAQEAIEGLDLEGYAMMREAWGSAVSLARKADALLVPEARLDELIRSAELGSDYVSALLRAAGAVLDAISQGEERLGVAEVRDMETITAAIARGFVMGMAAKIDDAKPVEALGGVAEDVRRRSRRAQKGRTK